MVYELLADLVLLVHLAFIIFVIFGGLLAIKNVKWAWLHAPAAVWAGLVSQYTYIEKRYTMRGLCRKAGVKPFGFHAIRHHVASILADSGKASLSQIQKMLRHRRVTTTDGYIKTLDPQLRQVANVLDECGKVDKKLKVVR